MFVVEFTTLELVVACVFGVLAGLGLVVVANIVTGLIAG